MKPSPTVDQQTQRQSQRRPRFWVAPLLVGVSFSLGFGVTKRVAILQANAEKPEQLVFAPTSFPGRDLERLRDLYGGVPGDLQVDVAALPAVELDVAEAPEPLKPEVETAVAPQPELQAALTPPQPDWTLPVWTDDAFEAASPAPLIDPIAEDSAVQPLQPVVLGTPALESAEAEVPAAPEDFFIPLDAPLVTPEF